jgi:NADH dehydrogenase
VRVLRDRGLTVRAIARDRARASQVEQMGAEVLIADVGDRDALAQAMTGSRVVVSAISGFGGGREISPKSVDRDGNRNLIETAQDAGVEHLVLLSTLGARGDHPIELFRMKHAAEQRLIASGLDRTIIRCAPFMETWATLLGEPLLKSGRTVLFGRGENPINFISAEDVARYVELAVTDPAMRGMTVEVGGPENLSIREFVDTFEQETGATGPKRHVPRPVMRTMSHLMRHIQPTVAGQIRAAVVMDTTDMSFDSSRTAALHPSVALTPLAEVIRRGYADARVPR